MKEKLVVWLAYHLPRSVAYWAAVRVMTYNYPGNPATRSCVNALNGWKGIKRQPRRKRDPGPMPEVPEQIAAPPIVLVPPPTSEPVKDYFVESAERHI